MSKTVSPYSAEDEGRLMTDIWSPELSDDPEAFIMFAFPWGQEGTPLANHKGPRAWQKEELRRVKAHIISNKKLKAEGKTPTVYKSATASGRGVGKSALTAWLNLWMMSCVIGGSCVTTANTEDQLKSKTWAELGKWHTLAINGHWFDRTALSLVPAPWYREALKTQEKVDATYYYAKATIWSEENPDAFAGLHSDYGILLIFDEASGVPENIWKVSDGFFTEPTVYRFFFCFSNPRRNTGAFFECFHKHRDYWHLRNLDARSIEGADIQHLNNMISQYGADSDAARVEVEGKFPRQGDSQFISREVVENAVTRDMEHDNHAALVMGVDIARFGDDSTVIRFRRGRDARSIPPIELKGKDNMQVANECSHYIDKYNPDAICIDAGNGTGVIDRLREMRYKVHEVWFGSKGESPEWANKRTDMWDKMRDWLGGGCIDDHKNLITDLSGPMYEFMGRSDKIMLEPKEKMKKRGLASPDHADALACTFAVRVARTDLKASRTNRGRQNVASGVDYDIFG